MHMYACERRVEANQNGSLSLSLCDLDAFYLVCILINQHQILLSLFKGTNVFSKDFSGLPDQKFPISVNRSVVDIPTKIFLAIFYLLSAPEWRIKNQHKHSHTKNKQTKPKNNNTHNQLPTINQQFCVKIKKAKNKTKQNKKVNRVSKIHGSGICAEEFLCLLPSDINVKSKSKYF